MSNVGLWEPWYADVTEPVPYGDTVTYKLAAHWLQPCSVIHDLGSGMGWFREQPVLRRDQVVNFDGTHNPFVDYVIDLADYHPYPRPDGVHLRHVLDHSWQWPTILANAAEAAQQRLFLTLFVPPSPVVGIDEWVYDVVEEIGVPDIGINDRVIEGVLTKAGMRFSKTRLVTPTAYQTERVWWAWKT